MRPYQCRWQNVGNEKMFIFSAKKDRTSPIEKHTRRQTDDRHRQSQTCQIEYRIFNNLDKKTSRLQLYACTSESEQQCRRRRR